MRIGEFAKRYGVTQDTVRHYLDIGLLVAEKDGSHYRFSEVDGKDLEKIIELKQMEFSLYEIQKILTFRRLSGTKTDAFRKLYLPFLEEKKKKVEVELSKYNEIHSFLDEKISEIKNDSKVQKHLLGVPLTALNILACPICNHSLNISDGVIHRDMLVDAQIQCNCGYSATIEDGIYIDKTAVRTKLLNGMPLPTKEEYSKNCSHTYANFMYKGMITLVEVIQKYAKDPKYIIEFDYCVGFFLLQYIKYLPPNTTYILIDYDKSRLQHLKENLEMYYEHRRFIFLCCDFNKLPIAHSSIDVAVDSKSSRRYAVEAKRSLIDDIAPLLKHDALWAASFNYCKTSTKRNEADWSYNELDDRGKILAKASKFCAEAVNVIDIGAVKEDSKGNVEIKEQEIYQAVYSCRKRTVYEISPKVSQRSSCKAVKTSG